jgi:hypothetical protein
MMVIVEQLVEWRLVGETEALGENLHQSHFVHHKSHMTWPGLESGPPRWEAATNRLSYGAALLGANYWLLQMFPKLIHSNADISLNCMYG